MVHNQLAMNCMTKSLDVMFRVVSTCLIFSFLSCQLSAAEAKPNVLFIAVDDLNDWVGCLGGHPDTKTPNIDRLAKRGVLFTNAHCQGPICNPSRTSIMFGLRPSTTGIYMNKPVPWTVPAMGKRVTMARHFTKLVLPKKSTTECRPNSTTNSVVGPLFVIPVNGPVGVIAAIGNGLTDMSASATETTTSSSTRKPKSDGTPK